MVTASFGIAEQSHLFRTEELDEVAFIEKSEIICFDAAISALSSCISQVVIPIPVIGAVIGNTIGNSNPSLRRKNRRYGFTHTRRHTYIV